MGSERPLEPDGLPTRIVRVRVGDPLLVLFTGPIFGHLEHWKGNEYTYPHESPKCPSCDRGAKLFYYAYASSQVLNSLTKRWEPGIIQVTACGEEQLRGMTLRGSIWLVTRLADKGKKGKQSWQHIDDTDPSTCPPQLKIEPALAKVMGPRAFVLGVKNPFESLETQESWSGPIPAGFGAKPLPDPRPATTEQQREMWEAARRKVADKEREKMTQEAKKS